MGMATQRLSREPRIVITSSQSALRVPRKRISELINYVSRAERTPLVHADVAVVNTAQIVALNRRHFGRRTTTDVISFDLTHETDTGVVAQIVVCADVAVQQGPSHGYRPQHELMLYVVHGLLHVMGYDDVTPPGRAEMTARQEKLLTAFLAPRRGKR